MDKQKITNIFFAIAIGIFLASVIGGNWMQRLAVAIGAVAGAYFMPIPKFKIKKEKPAR